MQLEAGFFVCVERLLEIRRECFGIGAGFGRIAQTLAQETGGQFFLVSRSHETILLH
jgi:hypothetical protein